MDAITQNLYTISEMYAQDFEKDYFGTPMTIWTGQNYPFCIGCIVVYLVFIFSVGKNYMKSREAFDLKIPLGLWNILLSTFSFIGMMRTMPKLLGDVLSKDFRDTVCTNPSDVGSWGHGPVGLWVMLFIFSKVPELIDTVFITLRKKPLIFLHWYHHVTVLFFCWNAFETRAASGLYFVAMNFSVHAIMYCYYALQAFNAVPKWFPTILITIAQITQMFVGTFVCMSAWYYAYFDNKPCENDVTNLVLGALMYGSYLYLFLEFFVQRYIFPKKKETKKKQ